MKIDPMEFLAVLAGGIIAGVVLAWVQKTFPNSGVTTL